MNRLQATIVLTTILLISNVSLPLCVGRATQPAAIQIELMASTTSWTEREYVGHAFMCISIPLNSGIKEDCFGFYPRTNSPLGYIGGPGMTNPEFVKNPSRFSRVTKSIKKPITEEQRRQVLRLVNEWDTRTYNLTNQSCIDFVNSVAQTLRWQTPPRVATDLPETFLSKLVDANP